MGPADWEEPLCKNRNESSWFLLDYLDLGWIVRQPFPVQESWILLYAQTQCLGSNLVKIHFYIQKQSSKLPGLASWPLHKGTIIFLKRKLFQCPCSGSNDSCLPSILFLFLKGQSQLQLNTSSGQHTQFNVAAAMWEQCSWVRTLFFENT